MRFRLLKLMFALTAVVCVPYASGQSVFPDTNSLPQPKATTENQRDKVAFDYFGMPMALPRMEFNVPQVITDKEEFTKYYFYLKHSRLAEMAVPYFNGVAQATGFNDYLKFELVSKYVDALLPEVHNSTRSAIKQYLLDAMGYRVRLAVNDLGDAFVMLTFAQPVYDRDFLYEEGVRLFGFSDESIPETAKPKYLIKLPSDSHLSYRPLNLRLNALNIPNDPVPFEISGAGLTIKGEVNRNLKPLLYRYPRMNVDDVALSTLDPSLRQSIIDQLRPQLEGLTQKEAVNKLLAFMHHGFPYATDEEMFGFEKPYFVEEMLLYPQSDCEDRSVFYSFLLWELLKVPNNIVGFDDHETVEVLLDKPVRGGVSYQRGDKAYFISDPTAINSITGQCDPAHQGLTPEVHYQCPTTNH